MAIQREIVFKGDDSQYSSIVDRIGKSTADAFESASNSIDETNRRLSDFSESVEEELEAIKKSGKDVFDDMLEASKNYSGSVKERLGYLQRELTLQEKLVREEQERERLSAKMQRESTKQDLMERGFSDKASSAIADDEYDEELTRLRSEKQVKALKMASTKTEYQKHRNKTIEEDDEEDDKEKKKGTRARNAAGRTVGAARGVANAAIGAAGFGAVLSIAGFFAKAISEGEELARATTSFRGLSNDGTSGVGAMYDLKTADSLKYGEDVAKSRGSIKDISRKSYEQYSFEKAYSLEAGEMNSMSGALRFDQKNRSASDVGLEMLNFFKQSKVFGIEKGDFTRVSELLGINNELNTQQVEQLENIDPNKSTNLMKAFGKMGVDSSRITTYTNSLNQGIVSPRDEFSQAIVYRALRQQNPNMSLFELQERQEQGIYGKGNLSSVMKQFSQTSSGEMLMKNVASAFGLKNFQARKLVNAYEKDNSIFDDEKGLKKAREITTADVAGRASSNTTTLQTLLVRFNDKFASWGEKMLNLLGTYMQAYDKDGFKGLATKLLEDIRDTIKVGLQDAYDYMTGNNNVEQKALRKTREEGIPTKGWFGDAFNDISPQQKKRREEIWKEEFDRTKNKLKPEKIDGTNLPKSMITRHGHLGKWLGGGMFNDDIYYAYLKGNAVENKNFTGDTRFELGGGKNVLEPLMKSMTLAEHEKLSNMSEAEIKKWDLKDGVDDGIIMTRTLKEILAEMRKSNQTKTGNPRIQKGGK